jgi:stage IV sporulation protein A
MDENSIYENIAKRTGGDIYVGVVGPVRTGKSTFIRRFIECAVLPRIENDFDRERTIDQIPQSASGRTVMTTEPKFVPDNAVKIKVGKTELNVKLCDCVGYMVDGALGENEDGAERLVNTPWQSEPMPLSRAAEIGTDKVIREHSTIALLISTDGSFGELARDSFIESEERIAKQLQDIGKPFAIILNSKTPNSDTSRALAESLEKKYSAPCALLDLTALNETDVREILSLVLSHFPLQELRFHVPKWLSALPSNHKMRQEIIKKIREFAEDCERLGDVERRAKDSCDFVESSANLSDGSADVDVPIPDECYFKTLSELCQKEILDEGDVVSSLLRLSKLEREYGRLEDALTDANESGYGIVMPSREELSLSEPSLAHRDGEYGVKVTASAGALHLIKTEISAELCPIVGTEEQASEVVNYLGDEFRSSPENAWDSNIFGKSLYDLVESAMTAKLVNIPKDSQKKLANTLERIVNEGANGLICILV